MPRSSLPTIAALLALLALAPAAIAPVSGPPTFTTFLVDEAILSGEPGLWLDTRTTTTKAFVHAPGQGIWRSTDSGSTWALAADSSFNDPAGVETDGDSSLAMDADGVLYLSGMLEPDGSLASTIPVQVSLDGGSTWIRDQRLFPSTTGIAECDRQWTDARGHGESVTSIRCGSEGRVWRTTNAGVSYTGPFLIATDIGQMGPIFYSPDGNLYTTYWDFEFVKIARSADGGLTWTSFNVAPTFDTRSFTVGAADSVGNLYVVWESSSSFTGLEPSTKGRIFIATSTNDGATWSVPKQISDEARTSIFPWVVAKAPGKVDVAFYAMDFVPGNPLPNLAPPDYGGPLTTWDVVIAQSLNGLAASPSYPRVTVVNDFHTGSICTSGLACVGPQNVLGVGNAPTPNDRRYLDYFEMRVDAAGNAFIAYGQDRPVTNCLDSCFVGDTFESWIDFRVAKQTGGNTIS